MRNNDIVKFSEFYNKGEEYMKERYKNENPEYKDIIDGVNVGLF